MRKISTSMVLAVLCMCGVARAAETNIQPPAALEKPVTLAFEGKSFDEAVRAVCAAVGVEVASVESAPLPKNSGGQYYSAMGAKPNYLSRKDSNGTRVYGLSVTKLMTAKKLLEELCKAEHMPLAFQNGKVAIGLSVAVPFNPDAFDRFDPVNRSKVAPNDWRQAVRTAYKETLDGSRAAEQGKSYNLGDRIPLEVAVDALLVGIKGHPEKDAVRFWLLSQAASRLWDKFVFRSFSNPEMAQVLAACREARAIYESPGKEKLLPELAALLRAEGKKLKAEPYIDLDQVKDLFFLEGAYVDALTTYALTVRDPAEAVKLSREATGLHWSSRDCDHLFDLHYKFVSGQFTSPYQVGGGHQPDKAKVEAWAKATKDDLTWISKHADHITAECRARFFNRHATALIAAGAWEEAAKNLEEAIKLDPVSGGYADYEMHGSMSGLHFKTSKEDKAWKSLADVYLKLQQPGKAVALLNGKLQAEPASLAILSKLGYVYKAIGKKDLAIQAYRKVAELDPAYNFAQVELNELEGKSPPRPASVEKADPKKGALASELHQAMFRASSAATRERLGAERPKFPGMEEEEPAAKQYAGIAAKARTALKDYPGDIAMLSILIECLDGSGADAESREYLAQLEKIDPKAAEIQRDRQRGSQIGALKLAGKREEALALIRQALAEGGNPSRYRSEEIQHLLNMRRYDEAFKVFNEHGQGITPESTREVHKALVLWGVGRKDEAQKIIERLKALSAGGPRRGGVSANYLNAIERRIATNPAEGQPTTNPATHPQPAQDKQTTEDKTPVVPPLPLAPDF